MATQVARGTSLTNATALLGHADEATTARHYVQRIHVAPDVRVVIDQLIQQTASEAAAERKQQVEKNQGPHIRRISRVGPLGWR